MKIYYDLNIKCKHEGCKEYAHYTYKNRKEYNEGYERNKNYLCLRHKYPEKQLMPDNIFQENTIVAVWHDRHKQNYWQKESDLGTDKLQSGHLSGHGWMALARNFPTGTRITETVKVELPISHNSRIISIVSLGEKKQIYLDRFPAIIGRRMAEQFNETWIECDFSLYMRNTALVSVFNNWYETNEKYYFWLDIHDLYTSNETIKHQQILDIFIKYNIKP